MSIAPLTEVELYELAFRVNSGFEITLYWNAHDGSTTIHIYHSATSETIVLAVPADRALDAFYHPFAHLARSAGDEVWV